MAWLYNFYKSYIMMPGYTSYINQFTRIGTCITSTDTFTKFSLQSYFPYTMLNSFNLFYCICLTTAGVCHNIIHIQHTIHLICFIVKNIYSIISYKI